MLSEEILRRRLANQHLAAPTLRDPISMVAHLGAVQAQDYSGARWALGQRLVGATDAAIERAFDDGLILRTHVMRPTWHFVAPGDIRWLLQLTGPRVHSGSASIFARCGLDDATLRRGFASLECSLRDGKHLTRAELAAAMQRDGLTAEGLGLAYVVMAAELAGLVCSGPRRGKQFTYALIEERAPAAPALTRDEALAELVRRYFSSHGPATIRDFMWWSGLNAGDTRRGLAMNERTFDKIDGADGLTYWLAPADAPPMPAAVYLLPNYDEYTIAYRDRGAYYDPGRAPTLPTTFVHTIHVDGRVAGMWRREYRKASVAIEPRWFADPTPAAVDGLSAAAERMAAFLGQPVTLVSSA